MWDIYHLSIRLSYSIFKGCHYQAIMNEVAVLVVFIKDYNNATNERVICIYQKIYVSNKYLNIDLLLSSKWTFLA